MDRIMNPRAVAVIGASDGEGKIGNSVMKNIINGGYAGELYPINPKADEILGKKAYKSVKDVPGVIDIAVFAVPARFCAGAMEEVGQKGIPGAIMNPVRLRRGGRDRGPGRVAGRGAQARCAHHGAEYLRLLLHPVQPLRHLLYAVRRQGQDGAVPRKAAAWAMSIIGSVARPRWGSPPSWVSATSPISTKTTF